MLLKKNKFNNILYFYCFILLFFSCNHLATSDLHTKGLLIYKKANCSSCHFWHANGGNSHGGAAPSLRNTELSSEELYYVIKCGRLGTNMPYFGRSNKKKFCKNSNNIEGNNSLISLRGHKLLYDEEILLLTNFIRDEIKNKPITKRYCIEFFGKKTNNCKEFNKSN